MQLLAELIVLPFRIGAYVVFLILCVQGYREWRNGMGGAAPVSR